MASCCKQGIYDGLGQREAANDYQWLKEAQEIMSSTASNYDITKLATGQTIAAGALLFASAAAGPTIIASLKTCSPILAVTLLYGMMMFASSYVEEEQHFWYWATTAWLAVLWIKSCVAPSQFTLKLTQEQRSKAETQSPPPNTQFSNSSHRHENSQTLESNRPKIRRRTGHSSNFFLLPPTYFLGSCGSNISMEHPIPNQ
jgi:hypothetical protein